MHHEDASQASRHALASGFRLKVSYNHTRLQLAGCLAHASASSPIDGHTQRQKGLSLERLVWKFNFKGFWF